MSLNEVAANDYTGALDVRIGFRGGELLELPHDCRLDCRVVRSQRYRVRFDRNTYLSDADALRFLSCKQQLHSQFGGLLRVPRGGLPKHYEHWRGGTQSRYRRFPDDGPSVCNLPPDHYLGRGSF